EGIANLTIKAENVFQTVSFDMDLDIVGMIRSLAIEDFSVVTAKGEIKSFLVTFMSLGSGTCMVVDWGDDQASSVYGDEKACSDDFAWLEYLPDEVTTSMTISHNYTGSGVYKISILAQNRISHVKDSLKFVVTSVPCNPPKVEIMNKVAFYLEAKKYRRGYTADIVSVSGINCSLTFKTTKISGIDIMKVRQRKDWTLFEVEPDLGGISHPVQYMDTISSSKKPVLSIPINFLPYGYYKVVYTLAMHGKNIFALLEQIHSLLR
ncbi:hypothetical protein SK128_013688, partial [Halocaridina rubra]